MIFPDKYLKKERALIGIGAKILIELDKQPMTLSSLWSLSKEKRIEVSYEKFIYTLDFLYITNLIELENGILRKIK